MFPTPLHGHECHITTFDVNELLFGRQTESAVIDTFVQMYLLRRREKKPNLFRNFEVLPAALKGYTQAGQAGSDEYVDYAFNSLKRPFDQVEKFFSPMHVGTCHWALLVIDMTSKRFQVYDSLRNIERTDIPEYVSVIHIFYKSLSHVLQATTRSVTV